MRYVIGEAPSWDHGPRFYVWRDDSDDRYRPRRTPLGRFWSRAAAERYVIDAQLQDESLAR